MIISSKRKESTKRMPKKASVLVCLLLAVTLVFPLAYAKKADLVIIAENDVKKMKPVMRVVIKTNVELTPEVMDLLSGYAIGINFVFEKINAVAMSVKAADLTELGELGIVEWIEQDRERYVLGDFSGGLGSWNLDMINVADDGLAGRTIDYDGDGVYVAVLDTGLVKHWRDYFWEESIATDYAAAFLSASWEHGPVETKMHPANIWERDTNSHGTHVASTILGYSMYGLLEINGVAPLAKVIPVKVMHNAGFGWSSAIAQGIYYVADLKESGEISEPIVISMSLGGPIGSIVEQEAIDYAINLGIPVVAAAGNSGDAGMDYPGALSEVISVGACGWTMDWIGDDDTSVVWWRDDVPENLADPDLLGQSPQVYITDFSGREKSGQDLDVVAPGSWVVGPFMPYGVAHPPIWSRGNPGEYYYVGGTSMATPHVSGIVALMLQKDLEDTVQDLTVAAIETIIEASAFPIPAPWGASILNPFTGLLESTTWDTDATGAGLIQADLAVDAV